MRAARCCAAAVWLLALLPLASCALPAPPAPETPVMPDPADTPELAFPQDAPADPEAESWLECTRAWRSLHVQTGLHQAAEHGRQAFHFVIEDGSEGEDGALTVGWRWHEQVEGAWTGEWDTDEWTVGVLVVDSERSRVIPTPAQSATLTGLVSALVAQTGLDPGITMAARAAKGDILLFPEKVECPLLRPWRYIVIHHSATVEGGAEAFDRYHKSKGWGGLGYHYVIGNGTGSADGAVEVGYRWSDQLTGAHAKHLQFNRYGIGICLVGNFQEQPPSPAQVASTRRLVRALQARYGIPDDRVYGHRDVREGVTECPGRWCPPGMFLGDAR